MFEVLVALISILGIAFLLWIPIFWNFKYWAIRGIVHDKPTIPRGNLSECFKTKHITQILQATYNKYKGTRVPYAGFYFNTQKALVVLDINLALKILDEDFHYFEDRGFFNNTLDDPLTGNLFLLDGDEWRSLKSKICPLFEIHKIRQIYSSLLEVGVELQSAFGDIVGHARDGIIDVNDIAIRYVLDVISNSVFGVNCHSITNLKPLFMQKAELFFKTRRHSSLVNSLIHCFPGWAKYFHVQVIPEEVTEYFVGFVEEVLQFRAGRKTRKPDFLSLLIEVKDRGNKYGTGRIRIDELAAQCFSFFITAFANCSSIISYILFELAANNDIQSRLRLDVYENFNSHGNFTFDCLLNMTYLDRIIMEALRKHPVNPTLFRKCTKRYVPTAYPSYYIDKGCTVIIPIKSYHYDNEYYNSPTTFLPNRFNDENIRNLRPGSYLPIGVGPRSCIGRTFAEMVVKIAIVKLIQHYKFEICSRTEMSIPVSMETMSLQPAEMVLKVRRV